MVQVVVVVQVLVQVLLILHLNETKITQQALRLRFVSMNGRFIRKQTKHTVHYIRFEVRVNERELSLEFI